MTLLIDLGNKPLAFAPALRSLLAGAAGGVTAIGIVANNRGGAMPKTKLGELEEQILLVLLRLEGESYTVPVANELWRLTGRDVSPATAYMVMRRLEERGLLVSSVGTPDPERGGRPRRFYRVVEETVLPLLRQSHAAMLALWDGLEPRLGES